jgi:hypothetical protein
MPSSAYDLRAIAERALARRYVRARVTSVYGIDEYGVTVLGREHEARVRTLSRSFHQVGDTVVLAAVNGDPQLLVILDAVGVTANTSSPYPPIPPAVGPLWPCAGGNYERTGLRGLSVVPAGLADDMGWNAAVEALGVVGVARGLSIASDCMVLRLDIRQGATSARVVCLTLSSTPAIRWSIDQTGDDPYGTTGGIVDGDYWYGGCTTSDGSGLHKIALADGSVQWVCPYYRAPYRALTMHQGRLYAIRDYQTLASYVEIDVASGSIVVERQRDHYGLGYHLMDGAKALASDGDYIVGMQQDLMSLAPTSARIIVMDQDLQPLRYIEMRDFLRTTVLYQPIPRLHGGLVWTCGGWDGTQHGGWLRAWDLASGTLQVDIALEDDRGRSLDAYAVYPAADHVAVWWGGVRDYYSPSYIVPPSMRTYTWAGTAISTYEDQLGGGGDYPNLPVGAPGTDARMWGYGLPSGSATADPNLWARETSTGIAAQVSGAWYIDGGDPSAVRLAPIEYYYGGDLALANGAAYYVGRTGSSSTPTYIRRIT